MELYFLRHGLAGQYGDPKYKDDSLRPLTAEGKRKMHQESLGMQVLGLKFDTILSSPYVRARQTAEIIARSYELKNKDIHLTNNLLPPASIKDLLKEARLHFPRSEKILLVGHEPHLTEMVSCLLNCKVPLMINLKKGGLCSVTLPDDGDLRHAALNWLLTPQQLNFLKPDL